MSGNIRVLVAIQKYYRIFFVGWVIASILVVVFLLGDLYFGGTHWEYKPTLLVAGIFIFHGIIKLIMAYVSRNINRTLYRNCDPTEFINIYRSIIGELQKLKKPRELTVYRLYISTGLIAKGEYEEAFQELEKCGPFMHNKNGTISRCAYYLNHCLICIHRNENAEAKNYLDLMKKEMAWLKHGSGKKIRKNYLLVSKILDMADGNYNEAESFFSDRFQKAKNNFQRIFAEFYLGEIYFHNGDIVQAKEAFNFVAQQGNRLYIAQQARERLNKMDLAS